MEEGEGEGEVELILLNVTREPLQQGVRNGSSVCFQEIINAAFIREML